MNETAPILTVDEKKELQNLISKGDRLKDIFRKLAAVSENLPPADRRALSLLKSQFNEFRRIHTLGTESREYLDRQHNRIQYRVSEFIDIIATANVAIEATTGEATTDEATNLLNSYPHPSPLFGYETELEKLRELFETEHLIGIHGMGGVGKTSFITNFIERHLPDKSKIIWQENCTDFEFDTFIANIGYARILQQFSGEDRYHHLLRHLECDEMVVFLDNFDPEEQENNEFLNFLKYNGSFLKHSTFVLIGGSRFHIQPLKIYNVELKGLQPERAVHFAKTLDSYAAVSLPDDKLKELVEKVQGNPQMIKSALDSLRYGVPWKELFSNLQSDTPYDNLLQSVFQHPEEKDFLLRFSVFSKPASRSAVKYVVGMEDDAFNDTVKRLIDKSVLSVIQSFEDEPRFTTSNLIREKSYHSLEDSSPWHRKAAEYFKQKRTEKLDIDLENCIFYQAKQAEWPVLIDETLRHYGKRFLAVGHFTLVNDMVNFLKERNAISPICFTLLGKIHYVKGDFARALEFYEEASRQAAKAESEHYVQIEADIRGGWVHYRLGDILKALKLLHEAFIASRESQIEPLEIEALNKLGWIYNIYDKPDITKGFYKEAEKIAHKLDIPSLLGHIYESQGSLYIDLEEYETAREILQKGLQYFSESGHQEGIAYIHRNLGHYHLHREELDKAREYYDKSLKYYLRIHYHLGISRVKTDLGWLEAKSGDPACGINQIRNAIALSGEIRDVSGATFGYYSIGKIYHLYLSEDPAPALENLLHAKALQMSTRQKTHRILKKIQAVIDEVVAGKEVKTVLRMAKAAHGTLPAALREEFGVEELLG